MAPSRPKGCGFRDVIESVLSQFDVPLSLSFINSTLSSKKLTSIDEVFMCDNDDLFNLQVLGNDIKISCKQPTHPPQATDLIQNETVQGLVSVLKKDLRKVRTLEDIFTTECESGEILFDDLVTKYSSNKRQINISFLVRNSHTFTLFSRSDKTFVGLVQQEERNVCIQMDHLEIMQHLKSNNFESVVVRCLWNLLASFHRPLNQGNFQSCYQVGTICIDAAFMTRYRNIFDAKLIDTSNSTAACVELKSECREMDAWTRNNFKLPARTFLSDDEMLEEELKCEEKVSQMQTCSERMECVATSSTSHTRTITDEGAICSNISEALLNNTSLIIVGDDNANVVIWDAAQQQQQQQQQKDSCKRRLQLLRNMKLSLEQEVDRNFEFIKQDMK